MFKFSDSPITIQAFPGLVPGNCLYMLRDDLIPYAFGGNKVRIAAEFIEDMHTQDKDALIMYGDLRSNLCRVLAFMCYEQKIPCLMVATSENGGEASSFNEEIVRGFDLEIITCEKNSIAEAVDEAFARLEARGFNPYYIYGDRTGSGNEGTAANAYEKIYQSICAWEQANSTYFDCIFTPYGTGCTQGGLICGSLEANDNRSIVGISISSRTPERANQILEETVKGWHVKRGKALPQSYASHIHLETKYNCGGYGAWNSRVDALIEQVLRETSVPLDPTYTGKALLGTLDYLDEYNITGKNILFLHTGGTPLFYDYLREARSQNCIQ